MALKVAEFNSSVLLELFLNGAVVGGKPIANLAGVIRGLDGLTLIIDTDTVTFTDTLDEGYKLIDSTKSIKQEIEDAATGVEVSFVNGIMVLKKTGGLTVSKSGTANAIFGFSKATDVVGVAYAGPSGTAPKCWSIGTDEGEGFLAFLETT